MIDRGGEGTEEDRHKLPAFQREGDVFYFVRSRALSTELPTTCISMDQTNPAARTESTLLQAAGSRETRASLLCSCLPSNPEVSCCFPAACAPINRSKRRHQGPSASETSGDRRVCALRRSTLIRGLHHRRNIHLMQEQEQDQQRGLVAVIFRRPSQPASQPRVSPHWRCQLPVRRLPAAAGETPASISFF
jgi:hypothetical protein